MSKLITPLSYAQSSIHVIGLEKRVLPSHFMREIMTLKSVLPIKDTLTKLCCLEVFFNEHCKKSIIFIGRLIRL